MAQTGASAYVKYGWESAFKIAATCDKIFGVNQKINRSENNNIEDFPTLGQRYASAIIAKGFDGSISMDFKLSNPWFLRGVFGNTPFHVSGTPDLFYYMDTTNLSGNGAKTIPNTIPSMSIENWIDMESMLSSDPKNTFLGCVIDTCTISAAEGEVVSVSLDIPFADSSYNRSAAYVQPASVADTFDVFTFADGTLKFDTDASGNGGTVIANVQNVELTFKNNMELKKSLGSRKASAKVAKKFECDVKMSLLFDLTRDVLEKFYGNTTDSSFNTIPNTQPTSFYLNLIFDNGLTGDNQRSIIFNIANVKIGESTLNQAVEDPIVQEVTCKGTHPTLVLAKNATTSEP